MSEINLYATILALSSVLCTVTGFFVWQAVRNFQNAHNILVEIVDILLKEEHDEIERNLQLKNGGTD